MKLSPKEKRLLVLADKIREAWTPDDLCEKGAAKGTWLKEKIAELEEKGETGNDA